MALAIEKWSGPLLKQGGFMSEASNIESSQDRETYRKDN